MQEQQQQLQQTANELIVCIGCCYGHGNAHGVQTVEPLGLKWKRIYPSVALLVESFTSEKQKQMEAWKMFSVFQTKN